MDGLEQYAILEIGDNVRQLVELVERLVALAERNRPKPRKPRKRKRVRSNERAP